MLPYLPFYLISLLPLRVLYLFSDAGFVVLYHLLRYRRDVVDGNLTIAFPHATPPEIRAYGRSFYKHFCDMWVEALKSLTLSPRAMKKRFTIRNPELVQQLFDNKISIIAFTGHLGNWEWLNSLALLLPHQLLAFYQPQSSRYFDGLIRRIRERYGLIAVESSKGYRTLCDYSARGVPSMTLVLGDQRPARGNTVRKVPFFGRETLFMTGGDRMAVKLNQAVVFPAIRKSGRGLYEVEFIPVHEADGTTRTHGILETYVRLLEQSIRENPGCWLWSHKRWKPVNG